MPMSEIDHESIMVSMSSKRGDRAYPIPILRALALVVGAIDADSILWDRFQGIPHLLAWPALDFAR